MAPYGLAGGEEGKRGLNIWVRKNKKTGSVRPISLGPRKTAPMAAGDHIIINTPGGGGYGSVSRKEKENGVGNNKLPPVFRLNTGMNGHVPFETRGSLRERNAIATSN